MTKKEKLIEVYKYLKSKGLIHTQVEFAKKIGYNKTNMSSAFAGKEKYLTDNLFKKICEIFPEINYEWLLTGEGEMLKSEITPRSAGELRIDNQNELLQVVKQQTEMMSRLMALNEESAKEKRELKKKIEEMECKIKELEKELDGDDIAGHSPDQARIHQ